MKYQTTIRTCLLIVATIAVLALLGTLLQNEYLLSIIPGYPPIAPNTASSIIILALCTWQQYRGRRKNWQPLLLLLVIVLSPLSPGLSAVCLTLLSIGLLLFYYTKKILLAQWFFQGATLLSFINILGYLFGVSYLYRDTYFGSAALQSCFAFILLSFAASLLHPSVGLIHLFVGDNIGARMTRRLFPAFTLVIIALACLRILAHKFQIVTVEFGIALFATSFLISTLFLIWDTAIVLNKVDKERKKVSDEITALNKNLENIIVERTNALNVTVRQLQEKEAALIKNEKLLNGVINNTTTSIVVKNKLGQYLLCNKAFSSSFNLSPAEIVGKTAFDLFPSEIAVNLTANESQIFESGTALEYEAQAKTLSGEKILHTNKFPIYDSNNTIYAICIVATDITSEKNALTIQEELSNKLQKRNNQLSNFAHITSHNLRSPVSNLVTLLDLLNRTKDQQEKDFLIGKFASVINRLASTLNDLVESLRIQEDTNKERELLSFQTTFRGIQEMLEGHIIENEVTIDVNFANAETLFYPKSYLESILLNLLSNAIKYRSNERKLKILISTLETETDIVLYVQDNGLGIDLRKYGDKLFGLNKTFHRHPEAKGVGLFLTKTQVESMGGRIEVESEPKIGSKFAVYFKKFVHE